VNDSIERLRSFVVEREKIACGSDIVTACNNSALRLSDLRALLAALEAAREDAERWRHARRILTVEDIEKSQKIFDAFGLEGNEHENRKADAAIDQARGKGVA